MTIGNAIALIKLCIPIGLILAVLWYRHEARTEHEARVRWQHTGQAYKAAQRASVALREATNARVVAQQQKVTNDVSTDYRARLADLRARYDRLRAQGAGSAPDHIALPVLSDAAPGTATAPGDELAWRLLAAEQAEQLNALITWTVQTAAVDPNAP